MDAEGAQVLRHRIEQHQNWLQADGVRDGRQPARDPDSVDLVQCAGTLRRYESSLGWPYEKRLVNGLWVAHGAGVVSVAASPTAA
jgi:hypothetical protein